MSGYGAGSSPGGVGVLGGPVETNTASVVIAKPTVAYFDPAIMSSPVATDTSIRSMHPVDQQVVLALSIEVGQIASVPDQGHTLGQLGRMAPAQYTAAALDAVQLALAGPLGRKDIDLLSVQAVSLPYGNNQVAVRYRNLRLAATAPRTVTRTTS